MKSNALYEAIERSATEDKHVYLLDEVSLKLRMFPYGSFQVEDLLWKDEEGNLYRAVLKIEQHGRGSMPALYVVGNHRLDGFSSGKTNMFRKENRYVRPADTVSMWLHFNEARVEERGLSLDKIMEPYLRFCGKNDIFHPSKHLFEKSGKDSFALMGELMYKISKSGYLDLIDFWYWNVSGEMEDLKEGAHRWNNRS